MAIDFEILPKLLTIEQVSGILGVHPNTLRNWDREGRLRAVRIGSRGDRRYGRETIQLIFEVAQARKRGDRPSWAEPSSARQYNWVINEVVKRIGKSKAGHSFRVPLSLPKMFRPRRLTWRPVAIGGLVFAVALGGFFLLRERSVPGTPPLLTDASDEVLALGSQSSRAAPDFTRLESQIFPQFNATSSSGKALGESTEAAPVAQAENSTSASSSVEKRDLGASELSPESPKTEPVVSTSIPPPVRQSSVGLLFAAISLFFGTIFFFYSLKYYGTLAIVLAFSRNVENGYANGNGNGNGNAINAKNGHSIFRSIFGNGFRNGKNGRLGLPNGNHLNGKGKNGNGNGNGFLRRLNGGNGHGLNGGNRLNGKKKANGNGFLQRLNGGNGNGLNGKNGHNGKNGRSQGLFRRLLFGNGNGNGRNGRNGQNGGNGWKRLNGGNGKNGNGNGPAGMWLEPPKIDLAHQPFISVHLPFFNEKKVANRILTATTAFDYQNYEVIIVDDSTDETKEILQKWARHPRVKVIHRENREGFKGGALKVALEHTDPKAEFVAVFDADFVPYPDTLLQFLRYFHIGNAGNGEVQDSNIAAVQGYQWHVLNKNENWITRSVRAEFAGSYVVERSGNEIIGSLKQVAGSVYMIRRELLNRFGWGTSITEDFELTVRLYAEGYRVLYTPYIQGPSECVSSLKRLIRQRMRWAEGHTRVIRHFFWKVLHSPHLKKREKVEFLYLAPYYLQAAFFLVGTLSWFIADAVLHTRLPFWTALWGWSLVFTNLLALPLVNAVGLFLEESPRRDYLGIFSFLALSYALVPFQAAAALKGLFRGDESPWFRTPKTGHITDAFFRSRFRRLFGALIPGVPRPRPATSSGASYLRLRSANNRFDQFRIVPRRLRWVSNAALAGTLIVTLFISGLAPFIPQREASASERGFRSLRDATSAASLPKPPPTEIKSPTARRYDLAEGKALEYIFHPEPRVRIKLGEVEIEMSLLNSPGLGSVATRRGTVDVIIYRYENVFDGVDLRYTVQGNRLEEDYVLSRSVDVESIDERVKLTNLVMAVVNGEIQMASDRGGSPIMSFSRPYLYEEKNPDVRNEGIRYEIEKEALGYRVRKVITDEGKQWLHDPSRVYPIVIDPPTLVQSSPITSAVTEADTDQGSYQRKLVYSSNSSAWYAFSNDTVEIRYNKCLASSNCDADADWAAPVTVSLDTVAQTVPSAWFQAAGTNAGMIFVSWIDDSGVTEATVDSLAFVTINTASADAIGTQCNTADQGTITAANRNTYIAVGNNGDVLVGYGNHTGADVEMDIFEVPTGTCTFTSIEASSGLPTASQNVAVVPFEVAANRIQIIYNDAGGNADIRQSQFDISTSTWNYSDNDVDGAANLNLLTFSAVSGGTSVWVLIAASATTTDFFRCATCSGDTAPTWVQSDAVPWSSQANISEVSLSYISTSPANTLAAMILKDTTNEQAYFKTTDADTISWSTEYNFNFTAGDNGNLSSTYSVANDTNVGVVIREAAAFSFSTLPERIGYLMFLAPILPLLVSRLHILRTPVRRKATHPI